MQRYLATISYAGGAFHGWQRQSNNSVTVQETLERALALLNRNRPVSVVGSSRTDTGVHALGATAHFDLLRTDSRGLELPPYDVDTIRKAVNATVRPLPVAVSAIEPVSSSFHARHDATRRTYVYLMGSFSATAGCFESARMWVSQFELDLAAMQEASALLLGTQDFSSFRGAGCQALSPIKTISEFEVRESAAVPWHAGYSDFGRLLELRITANSFLYHQVRAHTSPAAPRPSATIRLIRELPAAWQVRNMVGLLHEVGRGHTSISRVKSIIAARNRAEAPVMAPPQGLYLAKVWYDNNNNAHTASHDGANVHEQIR